MLLGRINEYSIVKSLGIGSFGIVYLVQDFYKNNYALKSIEDTRQNMQLAKKQAIIWANLNHPNIVKLHEFFSYNQGNRLAIVLEFCPNGDLADLFKHNKLTRQLRDNILKKVASALAYLHEREIAHRDIKPQNILMSDNMVPKIADFGSSKVLNPQRANTLRQGSLYYMAPEMFEKENYDLKVDIWSFGVLCYELLVGRRIMQVLNSRNPPGLSNDFPSEEFLKQIEEEKFRELVRKMLIKDPRKRLSIRQILEILQVNNFNNSQQKKEQHNFCPKHKGKSITLQIKNSRATNPSVKLTDELALVQKTVTRMGSSIRFKVQTISCGVGVGMTLRKLAEFSSYDPGFNYYKEHGCFILTHSGFSFSHSFEEENKIKTGFKYNQGDIIKVHTKNDTLHFTNETSNKQHQMRIRLSEKDWQQACFCVYLCGKEDSASIL